MAAKLTRDASFSWEFRLTVKTKCPVCNRSIELKPGSLYLTHTEGLCRRCGTQFSWKIGASKSEWYVIYFNEAMRTIEKMFHRWTSTKSVYFSKIQASGDSN